MPRRATAVSLVVICLITVGLGAITYQIGSPWDEQELIVVAISLIFSIAGGLFSVLFSRLLPDHEISEIEKIVVEIRAILVGLPNVVIPAVSAVVQALIQEQARAQREATQQRHGRRRGRDR